MTSKPALKVTFLIDADRVGDFIIQYAEKVHGLEISPVVSVPFNKNARTNGKEFGRLARPQVLALFDDASTRLTYDEVINKLPDLDRQKIRSLCYRLAAEGLLLKTKKGLALAPAASTAAKKNGASKSADAS